MAATLIEAAKAATGLPVRGLPADAFKRFRRLEARLASEQASARSAEDEANDLNAQLFERRRAVGSAAEALDVEVGELLDRLHAVGERAARANAATSVLSVLVDACRPLVDGGRAMEPVAVKRDPKADTATLRAQIADLKAKRRKVENAPLTADDAKAMARIQLDALARNGKPDVFGLVERGARISWPEHIISNRGERPNERIPDGLALVAWLHHDALVKALDAEVDRLADARNGVALSERPAMVAKLDADILALERQDAEAVWAAKNLTGFRPETHPLAVLGCQPKEGNR